MSILCDTLTKLTNHAKRKVCEVIDDLADELASTVFKHAKTIDFQPVIEAVPFVIPLLSTCTGISPLTIIQKIGDDPDVVNRVIASLGWASWRAMKISESDSERK